MLPIAAPDFPDADPVEMASETIAPVWAVEHLMAYHARTWRLSGPRVAVDVSRIRSQAWGGSLRSAWVLVLHGAFALQKGGPPRGSGESLLLQ